MDHFDYRSGHLFAENVAVDGISSKFGTPVYIYSRATLERHWHAFDKAFSGQDHSICYAVKANSNIAVLNILSKLGSDFDIVSAGELNRVIAAGGRADRTVFSGVGKTTAEIKYALKHNIRCFNVESIPELKRINNIASEMALMASISIRVNPDIDPQTHSYISTGLKENKFGIAITDAELVYSQANLMTNLNVIGIDCHIGSQLTSISPFVDALKKILVLIDKITENGIRLTHLNIGGGLGINYKDEIPPTPKEYATALRKLLDGRNLEILLEPGRAIAGNAGILVTRVEYTKQMAERRIAIVDAAMNDLLRPALYQSWQEIQPVIQDQTADIKKYDIVGPICETGDFLGKDRPLSLKSSDLLAIRSAGAYGFTMSSNYNSRPRAAEVMVDKDRTYLIRARETVQSLYVNERLLPE